VRKIVRPKDGIIKSYLAIKTRNMAKAAASRLSGSPM
jgi:hypothetical protein